jgi:hypothetical protein
VFKGVVCDPAPKEVQQVEVPVICMHTGAAELDYFPTQGFVGREIEFALAVVADVCDRALAGLQAVGAHDFSRRDVLDYQVLADGIERIDIEPGKVRFR